MSLPVASNLLTILLAFRWLLSSQTASGRWGASVNKTERKENRLIQYNANQINSIFYCLGKLTNCWKRIIIKWKIIRGRNFAGVFVNCGNLGGKSFNKFHKKASQSTLQSKTKFDLIWFKSSGEGSSIVLKKFWLLPFLLWIMKKSPLRLLVLPFDIRRRLQTLDSSPFYCVLWKTPFFKLLPAPT